MKIQGSVQSLHINHLILVLSLAFQIIFSGCFENASNKTDNRAAPPKGPIRINRLPTDSEESISNDYAETIQDDQLKDEMNSVPADVYVSKQMWNEAVRFHNKTPTGALGFFWVLQIFQTFW